MFYTSYNLVIVVELYFYPTSYRACFVFFFQDNVVVYYFESEYNAVFGMDVFRAFQPGTAGIQGVRQKVAIFEYYIRKHSN